MWPKAAVRPSEAVVWPKVIDDIDTFLGWIGYNVAEQQNMDSFGRNV
jgi:hypothetical protein